MTEVWKEVPSLPGYFVSSEGRIMRQPFVSKNNQKHGGRKWYGVWNDNGTGHGRYILPTYEDGVRRTFRVASMVCEAFHGPRPEGLNCLHRDEDASNNRPSNLYWGTQSENMRAPKLRALRAAMLVEQKRENGRFVSCG